MTLDHSNQLLFRPIFYLSRSSSRSIWLHLALVSCTVALNTGQDRAHHLAWPAVRETNSQELVDTAIVRGRGRGEDRTGPGHRHEIYCSAGLFDQQYPRPGQVSTAKPVCCINLNLAEKWGGHGRLYRPYAAGIVCACVRVCVLALYSA